MVNYDRKSESRVVIAKCLINERLEDLGRISIKLLIVKKLILFAFKATFRMNQRYFVVVKKDN